MAAKEGLNGSFNFAAINRLVTDRRARYGSSLVNVLRKRSAILTAKKKVSDLYLLRRWRVRISETTLSL